MNSEKLSMDDIVVSGDFCKRQMWKELLERTQPVSYQVKTDKDLTQYAYVYICGRIYVWTKPQLSHFIQSVCPDSHTEYFENIYRTMSWN